MEFGHVYTPLHSRIVHFSFSFLFSSYASLLVLLLSYYLYITHAYATGSQCLSGCSAKVQECSATLTTSNQGDAPVERGLFHQL